MSGPTPEINLINVSSVINHSRTLPISELINSSMWVRSGSPALAARTEHSGKEILLSMSVEFTVTVPLRKETFNSLRVMSEWMRLETSHSRDPRNLEPDGTDIRQL